MEILYNFNIDEKFEKVRAGQIRTDGEFLVLVIHSDDEEKPFNTILLDTIDKDVYYNDLPVPSLNEPNFSVTAEDILFEYPKLLDATLDLYGE